MVFNMFTRPRALIVSISMLVYQHIIPQGALNIILIYLWSWKYLS